MKSVGSILFVLFFACILAAAPGLPVIYLESSEQEHTVESTGTWAEINSSAPAGKTAGTLAEKLKSPGKSYRWTPSPMREKLTGGADLTDAVLSPDGSVLFLAERIGGSGKPNSTRLVFIDQANKAIAGMMLLEKRRISKIDVLPGSGLLLAAEEEQEYFSRKNKLLLIDPVKKQIIQQSTAFSGRIASFASDGKKVWCSISGEKIIYDLPLSSLTDQPGKTAALNTAPILSVDPDGTKLAVCGEKSLEIYTHLYRKQIHLSYSTPLPEHFQTDRLLFLSRQEDSILLLANEGDAFLFYGRAFRKLADRTGSASCFNAADNTLFLNLEKNDAFVLYPAPWSEPAGKPFFPGKIKPLCRNRSWKMFALQAKHPRFLLIDHRANIFKIEKTGKRWIKSALLVVDKTGFR